MTAQVATLFLLACAAASNGAVAQVGHVVDVRNLEPAANPVLDTLWTVGLDETAGPDSLFGIMATVATDPARQQLVVADPNSHEVRVFDAVTGSLRGRMGRRGGGPGEFRFAAWATRDASGTTLVYDQGRGTVVEFDAAFNHVKDILLEFGVSVETFLANDELLIFSGVVRQGPYRRRSIHVFDRNSGRHVRSFGRLPEAESAVVSETIGAGLAAWADDGSVWHAQRAPYLIRKYSLSGATLVEVRRENDFLPSAASAYRVSVVSGRMRIEADDYPVAVSVLETSDGRLLHQVWVPGSGYVLDVFGPGMTLESSWVGAMPVLTASLGSGRFAVSGRGPDGQYWLGVVRVLGF